MKKGKLIVIEGTDCSGKETQSKILVDNLSKDGYLIKRFSFPMYDTPTGKIIAGPYLGKESYGEGWFEEKADKVDPMVASLYFAADRKYNISKINKLLDDGVNVIVDRYVYSNMAHQGGKILDDEKRKELYNFIDTLEFKLLNLPKPDIALFLYMPYEDSNSLRVNRKEALDQHENDPNHLKHAEKAYKELANMYNWKTIDCVNNHVVRSIEDISYDIYDYIKTII